MIKLSFFHFRVKINLKNIKLRFESLAKHHLILEIQFYILRKSIL